MQLLFTNNATNNAIIRTYITVLWYHQILRRDRYFYFSVIKFDVQPPYESNSVSVFATVPKREPVAERELLKIKRS